MTGRRDLAFLDYWNRRYRDFVGPGPELHGAYGYRIRRHLGVDQLERAYRALESNPDTRQVVIQIWDSPSDLPAPDGTPADRDIPCNVAAMPKIRDGKLEWMQVIRSNDMMLGVPHNFVQFTSMQEILAGWLGVECGSYSQISDSLHVYDSDWDDVMRSTALPSVAPNDDSLALPRRESDRVFRELELLVEQLIDPATQPDSARRLGLLGRRASGLQEHSCRPRGGSPSPSRPDGCGEPDHVPLHQPRVSSALVPVVLRPGRGNARRPLKRWHS